MRVIDFHDDRGMSFRASGQEVPEILKCGSAVEPSALLDRDFALILVDKDDGFKEYPKFASHDAGNHWMSMWYLENVDHGLPAYAAKVAAQNLRITARARGYMSDETLTSMFPGTMAMAEALDGEKSASADERRVLVSRHDFRRPAPAAPAKVADFDKLATLKEAWAGMDGYDRRVAALELEDMADIVEIPSHMREYMGHEAHPSLRDQMRLRAMNHAKTAAHTENYTRIGEMALAGSLAPDDAVEAIHIVDEANGYNVRSCYGEGMHDPYRCVFGLDKAASYSWVDGTHYVNERQLKQYAASPASTMGMKDLFVDKTVTAFRLAPLKVFKALPREQKILIARQATQDGYGNDGNLLT